MAVGGYIASQFQWVGGRTDSQSDRLNYVLTGIIEALINSNTGWDIDTDFMSTTKSYTAMLPYNSTNQSIAKFLINQNGMRLVICYSTGSLTLNSEYTSYDSSQTHGGNNGISMAVIPPGTGETWNTTDPTYVIALPSSAVGWCSVTFHSTWSYTTFVKANNAGTTYSYFWISKGNQLALFEKSSSWTTTYIRGCVIGEILGGLAQGSDNIPNSRYGYINLNKDTDGETTSPSYGINSNDIFKLGNSGSAYVYFGSQIFRADGTSLRGMYNDNNYVYIYPLDLESLKTSIANLNLSTGGRWTPFAVALCSSNPTTDGVVAGDGFKGYLDTDFIRYVPYNAYTRGQTLGNNSEFYFLGGGVAIGWNYSNTSVSLF